MAPPTEIMSPESSLAAAAPLETADGALTMMVSIRPRMMGPRIYCWSNCVVRLYSTIFLLYELRNHLVLFMEKFPVFT
jgi:hypothetical protein